MRRKSLAEQLAELNQVSTADVDPEEQEFASNQDSDADLSSGDENDEKLAREHYVPVGKSKLRQMTEEILLEDPKYRGQRANREDLMESADEEWEKMRSDDDQQQPEDEYSDEYSEDEEKEEASDDGSDEDIDEDEPAGNELTAELARFAENDKILLKNIKEASVSDVEKGKHTRNMFACYDSLLDIRIRSQRCLQKANSMPPGPVLDQFKNNSSEISEKSFYLLKSIAELTDSLLTLQNSLISESIPAGKTSGNTSEKLLNAQQSRQSLKRKLTDDNIDDLMNLCWKESCLYDKEFITPFRNETIEKWHRKVQVVGSASLLNKKFKALNQNPVEQITQWMATDKERLVSRTRMNRQDVQTWLRDSTPTDNGSSSNVKNTQDQQNPEIFDDNDFYSMLLRELIYSKIADSSDPNFVGMQWAKIKELQRKNKKVKDNVDRRASKGRKIRYEVHEKLVNFMVPHQRATWHEEMIDEICAAIPSVFAQ